MYDDLTHQEYLEKILRVFEVPPDGHRQDEEGRESRAFVPVVDFLAVIDNLTFPPLMSDFLAHESEISWLRMSPPLVRVMCDKIFCERVQSIIKIKIKTEKAVYVRTKNARRKLCS